jgi:hypothetical protein
MDSRGENLITGLVLRFKFSRDGRLSKENQKRLRGTPSHQHEGASRYGQHQERGEMMIVALTVQGSFFHVRVLRVTLCAETEITLWAELVRKFP